jgi:hypothetical protein
MSNIVHFFYIFMAFYYFLLVASNSLHMAQLYLFTLMQVNST